MGDNTLAEKLLDKFMAISAKIDSLIERYNANEDVAEDIAVLAEQVKIYKELADSLKISLEKILTRHEEGCSQCPTTQKLAGLGPWDDFLKSIKRISTHDVYFMFLGAVSSASLIAIVAIFWKFVLKAG